MSKVLLIIMYVGVRQTGITSQSIEDMTTCEDMARKINGVGDMRAFCVEASK